MLKAIFGLLIGLTAVALGADIKISQLPLGTGSTVGPADSFPYVWASPSPSATPTTQRLLVDDLVNVPAFQTQFLLMIPSQTGEANMCLQTNGTNTFWSNCLTGTPINVLNGGTGTSLLSSHSIVVGQGTSPVGLISPAPLGDVLISKGPSADPSFTPNPVLGVNATTAGSLGIANGAGSGATVTLQNLGATSAYNFNLPTTAGSSGQVLTSQGGASTPMTWTAVLSNPMTTLGDIIYENASPAATRLPGSTSASLAVLTQTGNGTLSAAPAWSTSPALNGSNITTLNASNISSGTLAIAEGGTNSGTANGGFNNLSPLTTAGDLIYGGVSGAGTRLGVGSTGQVLTVVGGNPAWGYQTASTASANQRIERAHFGGTGSDASPTNCTTSTCTIYSQSGSWLTSVTRTSTGQYNLNITGSEFSAAPVCTLVGGGSGSTVLCIQNNYSATTTVLVCRNLSNTANDADVGVICMGPS